MTNFAGGKADANFLAGGESRHWLHSSLLPNDSDSEMKLYMAWTAPWREEGLYNDAIFTHHPFILESFYYADDTTEKLIPYFGDFLLDSGAFTFMHNQVNVNWDEYTEKLANFVIKNKIKKYFEMDIDSIVGYEKVIQLRKKLEKMTNVQPIPVWHQSRGKEEFLRCAAEYPYVALGGIVGAGKGTKLYKEYHARFPWFIKMAHKNGAKIHGLGFTSMQLLPQYHFDSVDSTAWTTGNRFGYIYYFDGKTMQKIDTPKGKKLGNSREVALNNYLEWIKFQKYADINL